MGAEQGAHAGLSPPGCWLGGTAGTAMGRRRWGAARPAPPPASHPTPSPFPPRPADAYLHLNRLGNVQEPLP